MPYTTATGKRRVHWGRGRCSECGREMNVNKDGTIRSHGSQRERLMNCHGSGLLPLSEDTRARDSEEGERR